MESGIVRKTLTEYNRIRPNSQKPWQNPKEYENNPREPKGIRENSRESESLEESSRIR